MGNNPMQSTSGKWPVIGVSRWRASLERVDQPERTNPMDLKAGDIVMLKSGGQPLTVVDVKGDEALCVWMGMEGDLYRDTLPLVVLARVEEEEDEEEDDDDEEED
jgi:uncharacterized protein YodC (DUF2158 family)